VADLPVAEGGRPGGGGSHWLAIGAIAGVGTLLFLMFKGGGSSTNGKTTAAGTSINAALGSIQEQQLNMMGQLGAGINTLSTQASDYNQSQLAAMSGMQDALSSQISGLDSSMQGLNTQLMAELGTINSGVIANGQSIAGVSDQLNKTYQTVTTMQQQTNQQYNALQQQITAQGTAATEAQQQTLAQLANLSQGLGVWASTLAQKSDYLAAVLNTYLPNLYQRVVMGQ